MLFSGGAAQGTDAVLDDTRAVRDGNGSIVGRNCFHCPHDETMQLLVRTVDIYLRRE